VIGRCEAVLAPVLLSRDAGTNLAVLKYAPGISSIRGGRGRPGTLAETAMPIGPLVPFAGPARRPERRLRLGAWPARSIFPLAQALEGIETA
jgi:hypothetical protein